MRMCMYLFREETLRGYAGPAPALLLPLGFGPASLRKELHLKGVQHYAELFMCSELKALSISFAMNETA